MSNSNKEQSKSLLSGVFGVAKKLSHVGVQALNQNTKNSTRDLNSSQSGGQVIEGEARQKPFFEIGQYDHPNQLLREHLPKVSRQLLGRHYGRVNSIAQFVLPSGTDKLADELFNSLSGFASSLSSAEWVLDEAGAKSLDDLAKNIARSARVGDALAQQNKVIAVTQGAVTGVAGLLGAAIDVPASITLALRSIYQTGRAYGFELDSERDQDVVEYIFKQIDLSLIAEKQAVLVGVKAIRHLLETQDVKQLQQLLGSDTNFDVIQQWLAKSDQQLNLQWLSGFSKIKVVAKITPVLSAVISAAYSWKLIDETTQKAQEVFQTVRQYLQQHPDQHNIHLVDAYEKAKTLLSESTVAALLTTTQDADALEKIKQTQAEQAIQAHETISEVHVEKRETVQDESNIEAKTPAVEEKITQGLADLVDKHVEPSPEVPAQQPALTPIDEEDAIGQADAAIAEEGASEADNEIPQAEEKPQVKEKKQSKEVVERPNGRPSDESQS